jgi:hypothetical protein
MVYKEKKKISHVFIKWVVTISVALHDALILVWTHGLGTCQKAC